MNKRLGLALAVYLTIWAAVAAGIVYGLVRAGYPVWVSVVAAFLVFALVNSILAHRARARQAKLEGKEPPPYLKFLFFPQGVPRFKEQASKFDHVLVGMGGSIADHYSVGRRFSGSSPASRIAWCIGLGIGAAVVVYVER